MSSSISSIILSGFCGIIIFLATIGLSDALAARYYSEQTNFVENFAPTASYKWDLREVDSCIYKDKDVPNSYYAWTKLAVQKWRQALREYTDNQEEWSISARYVKSQSELDSCDVNIFIYKSYKDFPDYPSQTGAYTLTREEDQRISESTVYLSPLILHGDGRTEIDLPSFAFRNSAIHEIGHVLGLGHMKSEKGYLMSPQFDFQEQESEFPVTTLELRALVRIYDDDGFE